jgi:hypothetical protein
MFSTGVAHRFEPLWNLGLAANKFFEERSDQSEVKARIVQKYFLHGPT